MSTLKTNNIQHVDRSEPSILIDTSGSVSIAGTLTYEDVTNIDSVGIITARSDVSIADKIVHTGDTNTAIRFPANDTFTVETSGVERLRINSGGEVLIGDDTSEITMGLNANVQIFGTNASESSFAIKRGSNDAQAAFFVLSKSRNTSVGSRTILNDGDEVGNIFFVADDGTDLLSETAAIKSQINGAPGANDTPGNLSFWTTSDGANAATRRMTITSAGNIGINESSPSHKLVVGGDIGVGFNTPNDAARQINFNVNRGSAGQTLANINWQWNSKYVAQIRGMAGADTTNKDDGNLTFYTSAANSLVERLRITSAGSVTIGGETSPDWKLTVYDAGFTGVTIKTNRSGATENIGGLHFKTQSTNVAYFQSLVDGTLKFRNTSSLTERLRIDTSGRLLIGHDTGNGYPQLSVSGNTAGASGAGMLFLRRGLDRTTIGGNVGADLGAVEFGDLDGNIYASIQGKTGAATSSDSDVPGRIILATVKDGTNTMQEKVRIDHESTVAFFHNGTNHVTVSVTSQCNGVGAGPSPAAVCFAVGRDSGTSRSAHFAGHIQMASGYGIDFSPTGDASGITPSAEVLDEYEEGIATFQLHINGGEASGVSYSYNTGPYTRIGRLVFCQISMFATNLPADTGGIDITVLPFVDGGGGGYRESAFIAGNHSLGTNPSVIFGAIHGSGSKIRLRKYGSGDLDGSDIGSTFWMHGSITYNTT